MHTLNSSPPLSCSFYHPFLFSPARLLGSMMFGNIFSASCFWLIPSNPVKLASTKRALPRSHGTSPHCESRKHHVTRICTSIVSISPMAHMLPGTQWVLRKFLMRILCCYVLINSTIIINQWNHMWISPCHFLVTCSHSPFLLLIS